MSAGCTTPARDAGGGSRTLNGPRGPRRSQCRAFAFYATPAKALTQTRNSGGRARTSMTCSKDRRPAFRRPRNEKRTRHDSNVRPQAPQACALILLSYGSEEKGRGEGRRGKSGRSLVLELSIRTFTLRLSTFAFSLAEGAGVEPAGALQAPTVFGTAWRARAQPSTVRR